MYNSPWGFIQWYTSYDAYIYLTTISFLPICNLKFSKIFSVFGIWSAAFFQGLLNVNCIPSSGFKFYIYLWFLRQWWSIPHTVFSYNMVIYTSKPFLDVKLSHVKMANRSNITHKIVMHFNHCVTHYFISANSGRSHWNFIL